MASRRKVLVGDMVTVKTGWNAGAWGLVAKIDDGYYYVAIYGDYSYCPIFERSEIRLCQVNTKC